MILTWPEFENGRGERLVDYCLFLIPVHIGSGLFTRQLQRAVIILLHMHLSRFR